MHNRTAFSHVSSSTKLRVVNRRSLAVQGLSKTTLLRGLREEQLREGLEALCGVVADIRLDALEIAAIVNFKDSSAARGCLAKQMTFPGVNLTFVRTNHALSYSASSCSSSYPDLDSHYQTDPKMTHTLVYQTKKVASSRGSFSCSSFPNIFSCFYN